MKMEESWTVPCNLVQMHLIVRRRGLLWKKAPVTCRFYVFSLWCSFFPLPTGKRLLPDAPHCPSEGTRFLVTCYV